jgi:hypothetical protein
MIMMSLVVAFKRVTDAQRFDPVTTMLERENFRREVSSRHHDARVYRLFLHPAPQFWAELPRVTENSSLEHRGTYGTENRKRTWTFRATFPHTRLRSQRSRLDHFVPAETLHPILRCSIRESTLQTSAQISQSSSCCSR